MRWSNDTLPESLQLRAAHPHRFFLRRAGQFQHSEGPQGLGDGLKQATPFRR